MKFTFDGVSLPSYIQSIRDSLYLKLEELLPGYKLNKTGYNQIIINCKILTIANMVFWIDQK